MGLESYSDAELMAIAGTQKTSNASAYSDDELMAIANQRKPAETVKASEPGLLTRIGTDLSKRASAMVAPENYSPYLEERALRMGGQIAGAAGDVVGQTLKSAYRTLMPQKAQDVIASGARSVLETPVVQDVVQGVGEKYGQFKEAYPNVAKDVEAVANIATLVPIGKGAKGVKAAAEVAGDIAYSVGRDAEQQIANTVKNGINKAIRPTVVGKGNATQTTQYYNKATDAVKNIVANRSNLELTDASGNIVKNELPKTLSQFSEAIDQTKKTIFDQYDNLAKQAGDKGAFVNLKQISTELSKLTEDSVINDLYPNVASYIKQRAGALSERGLYTAQQAQEAIRLMNKSLEAFYKNPSFESASRASVDAMVVNHLRKGLDDVIEKATGSGYQELKNSYGALKSIEKEVAHRAIVDARKNVKGLIDFTDIFTGGELIAGLATMNPAIIAKAGVQKGIASLYKRITSPNYHVSKMFGAVDEISKRQAQGFKSKILQRAEGMFPDNPLETGNIQQVPPGKPYMNQTNIPSTEVKSPRWIGSSQAVSPVSTKTAKQLPPGQGFSLSGEPYTPEVIDAIFTSKSRPIKSLPGVNADEVLTLPPGQGFTISDEVFPVVSNVKLRAGEGRNPGLTGLRSYRGMLRK